MKTLQEIKMNILDKYGFGEIGIHNTDLNTAINEIAHAVHRQACKEQKQITAFNFDDDRILNDTEPEFK